MSDRFLVVDTAYLLELFKVDGHCDENAHKAVSQKFKSALQQDDRIYVPISTLFELVNHIAHIKNGSRRVQLAKELAKTVKRCIETENPWIITPSKELASIDNLQQTLEKFSNEYSAQGLGMTDTSILLVAKELKQKYQQYHIHIWTRDLALKALEPDAEKNAFT